MTEEMRLALREWCTWIHSQADLSHNASKGQRLTWDGKPTTWLDHMSVRERAVMEACMKDGVFEPILAFTLEP